jgi:serine protease
MFLLPTKLDYLTEVSEGSMRIQLAFTVFAVLLSQAVFAARYAVVYKDKASFNKAHTQFMLFNQQDADLKITNSLRSVQALVIEGTEASAKKFAAGKNVVLEKEAFYPAPKPVMNYQPTVAWSFDKKYAHLAFARKKTPVAPATEELTAETVTSATPWGIDAIHSKEAWVKSNKGAGSRVLVLDTGIDKDHPALKNQLEAAEDFVGDAQAPYPAFDVVGHGTHVSGTILAEEAADGFVGVAPSAKLLMGRVCSTEGCSTIAVAEGMDWGISQHVDVINLSLGGPFGTNIEKQAVERAEQAGITVVAASGNDSTPTVGYPAAFPTVIAVGAVDSNLQKASFSQWGPELDVVAPGVEVLSSVPLGSGCQAVVELAGNNLNSTCFSGSAFVKGAAKELVAAGLGKPEDFVGKDLSDKYALIQRGEITFHDKVVNALAAGAVGVVIYNNVAGVSGGTLTEDGSLMTVPVAMIEQSVGEALVKDLATGQKMSIVLSTEAADYAKFNGTSMASPHVAGVVALMKAANKALTPSEIRKIIADSSHTTAENSANEMGKGVINALEAVEKAAQ